MDDQEDKDAKMLYMALMFVIAESNFVASVIAKKRKVAPDHQVMNQTLRRKLYDRPVYMQSTWWIMYSYILGPLSRAVSEHIFG